MNPAAGNSAPPPGDSRPVPALCAGAIVLGALAAYADSFSGAFVLDDVGSIASNPTLRHLGTAFFPPSNGSPVSGRPVVNLSFALNYAMGGTGLWGYHAVSLLIHVLAGLVLFGIVRRTLGRIGRPRAAGLALAVALFWTVHPLQTAAVTYLSQRAESLMGLFYLLTVYAFLRGAEDAGLTDGSAGSVLWSRFWFGLSWAACLCGMGAKEVMVTAPVTVLLYDRTFVSGSFARAVGERGRYYAALAATWIFLAVLAAASGSRAGTAGFSSGVPWWAYGLAQFRAVAHYLRLAVWPFPLVADYGRVLAGTPWEIAGDAVVLSGLAAGAALLLRRRSPLGFAGVSFFLILAPSSSIVPVATEIVAEHRMYLPLACVLAAIVCCADQGIAVAARRLGWRSRRASAAGAVGAVAVAAVLAAATASRNRVYRSVLVFWGDVVAKVPGNAGARNNLGNALAAEGDLAGASTQFREALRLAPDYADAHGDLANLLLAENRPGEAIDHYRAALRFQPQRTAWRLGLATAAYRMGNGCADRGTDAEAADWYAMAVGLRPDFADARVNYGLVLARLGRPSDSARQFAEALRLEPRAADVHNDYGGLLAGSGRLAEARAQFEEALRLKPDYREARDNLDRVNRMEAAGEGSR